MFPNTVALYPSIARSLTEYRLLRLPAARERARHHGLIGAMQPWESALLGFGVSTWKVGDENEIHISGDVPMAFRLYYRMSRNQTWLRSAWPLLRDSANFFASRVVREPATGNWTLLRVIMPDEGAGIKNSSAYTNAIAAETLRFALDTALQLGLPAAANWTEIAANMFLPIVTLDGLRVHAQYEGYNGQPINQADVALMQYPLSLPMDHQLAVNDLMYYQARSSGPSTAGFYTGDSAYSIAWLQLGNRSAADAQFDLAFDHMDMGHYNVWKEKSFGNFGNLNFITGAGGYLQNYINGYAGLQYTTGGGFTLRPCIPPHAISGLTLRGLALSSFRFHVHYNSSVFSVTLSSTSGSAASCSLRKRGAGQKTKLQLGQPISMGWAQGDVFEVQAIPT